MLACLAVPALAADTAPARTLHFPLTVDHMQARQVRHNLELAYANLNIELKGPTSTVLDGLLASGRTGIPR